MKLFFQLLFLSILSCFWGINGLFAQQKVKGTIEVGDLSRTYRLYLPATYSTDEALPLVINMHGLTSDAGQQQLYSRMNEVAEKEGFIVCYPKGKNRAWNVNFPFPASNADDVKFIAELIDELSQQYAIDTHRIYACGFSNGGYMSYKLACELSDKIVAIASVAGTFVPGEEENCNPERAVPVLQIHGTSDPIVHYKGSPVARSVKDLVEFWRDHNGCSEEPESTKIDNKVKLDLSRVTRYDFQDCRENGAVVLYKIRNGGHTWPGAKIITGVTNKDINASEVIWDFFRQFSFEEPASQSRQSTTLPQSDLKVFPNPTFGNLQIKVNLEEATTVSRRLYNLQGQSILPLEIQAFTAGRVQWNYDLGKVPAGMYFLKIQEGTKIYTKKIVVRH